MENNRKRDSIIEEIMKEAKMAVRPASVAALAYNKTVKDHNFQNSFLKERGFSTKNGTQRPKSGVLMNKRRSLNTAS